MERVIGYAVGLAMTLAAAGQLPRATMWLAKQMPRGPKLVSLSDFNRMLIDGERRPKHRDRGSHAH